jgi:uncharacterized membrane protein
VCLVLACLLYRPDTVGRSRDARLWIPIIAIPVLNITLRHLLSESVQYWVSPILFVLAVGVLVARRRTVAAMWRDTRDRRALG